MLPSSSEEGLGVVVTDRVTMLDRAAHMRREPTETERRLWRALSRSQLGGYKFRRQAIIGGRIADFFCPAKGLVVEIDGDTHDPGRDHQRDAWLGRQTGFAVVRFTNRDVMTNLEGVLTALLKILEDLPDRWPGHTTPGPTSEEEGSR
jgi:very-short-patch-repair endonuclease